jgi:hypothetical protein
VRIIRCEDYRVNRVSYRQPAGLAIAGLVAFFGALPIATLRWYLAPIALVPLAAAVWAWRSGTDADPAGVTVRALIGKRRIPWERITGFVPDRRRVLAVLDDGGSVRLPAVSPDQLPNLIVASGQQLTRQAQ